MRVCRHCRELYPIEDLACPKCGNPAVEPEAFPGQGGGAVDPKVKHYEVRVNIKVTSGAVAAFAVVLAVIAWLVWGR